MSRRLFWFIAKYTSQQSILRKQLVNEVRDSCFGLRKRFQYTNAYPSSRNIAKKKNYATKVNSPQLMSEENPQVQVIIKAVNRSEPLKPTEWASVREEVLKCEGRLTSKTVDSYIMLQCNKSCNFEAALSLLTYLEVSTSGPNLATLAGFFRLWNACGEHQNESEMLSRYDNLRKKYPLLDAATAESAAMALSRTSRWEEAFKLLDMIKLTQNPKSAVYTSLAVAAFNNGKIDLGHSVLEEALEQDDRQIGDDAYLAWLQCCEPEELLRFFAAHGENPTHKVVQNLSESLKEKGKFGTNFTTVDSRGMCCSCGKLLLPQLPTPMEFQQLKTAMFNRVLLSTDVFLKTSPKEVSNFQEMLQNSNGWNVVIDGLNVALATGSSSSNDRANMLLLMVKHFQNQGKSMLVLGRKHMRHWPERYMSKVFKYAQLFLADDLSQDDPLVLLAALHSGLGTHIVSRDLMRTHMYLLKDKSLRSIFRRWQYSHQCFFEIRNKSRVIIKEPLTFHPFAQQSSDGGWHIPYKITSDTPKTRFNHMEVPENWLCVTKSTEL